MLGCAIPASTNYLAGAEININFGSLGATYYLCITQIQLEAGTSYTAFDIQPPAVELARCQRRYWRNAPGATSCIFGNGFCNTVGYLNYIAVPIPTIMATTPAITFTNDSTMSDFLVVNSSGTNGVATSLTFTSVSGSMAYLYAQNALLTVGMSGTFLSNSSSAWIAFSSDL